MTKNELDKYITKNEKDIIAIILKHTNDQYKTKRKYDKDVVFSNIYIHLEKNLLKLTFTNIESFIVTYCYRLKYWFKNRHIFLTEDLMEETNEICLSIEEDYFCYDGETDYMTLLQELINNFCILNKTDNVNKTLIEDYYKYNILNYKDVMKLYNQKYTYSFRLLKVIRLLISDFEEYCKEELDMEKT